MQIKQLLKFLCKFIEDQINKCDEKSKFDFGPDAEMNPSIIADQIEELLGFAKVLMQMLEDKSIDQIKLISIFNQIHFYHNLEYVRYHARWIVCEKLNHTEFKKIEEQRNQLSTLAKIAKFNIAIPVALTEIQKQYEYDSRKITYFVLDLALNRDNSKVKLDPTIFSSIWLGKNLGLAQTIHSRCKKYLDGSSFSKSSYKPLSADKVRMKKDILKTIQTKILEQKSTNSTWMTLFTDAAIATAATVILDEVVDRLIH